MPSSNDNPGIQPINTTNYFHYRDPNCNRVENVIDYNGEGQPALRIMLDHEAAGRSAFGEPISVQLTPIIQLDALYEYDPREFQTFTANGGAVQQDTYKTLFQAHTGTQAYGYGLIRSNRIARYRPGQGFMARFTAMYGNPQAGVTLRAGLIAQEQSLVVGYNGTQFGILRQNGGKAQIVKLTINSNTIGTATITLNGSATNVSLTTTNTTTSAREIAATAFTGWQTQQIDNVVWFLADLVGVKSGANSINATITSGTISVVQTGVAHTDTWIYQSDWNIDKLDGTGVSGITLDKSKLNIFQIQFRWLGAGEIRFALENPDNGDMIFFHHIHYSNKNTVPHLDNPSFRIGYAAYNTNNSTIIDSYVHGASMLVAVEGQLVDNSFTTATNVSKTSLAQTTVHGLMTLKNKLIHRDKINLRRVLLKTLSVAFQGNDPCIIYLFLNGTFSTTHTFEKIADYSSVAVARGTGSFTLTNEHSLAEFVLPINGSGTFDLSNLGLTIPPNSRLNIAVSSGQQIASIVAAATWIET